MLGPRDLDKTRRGIVAHARDRRLSRSKASACVRAHRRVVIAQGSDDRATWSRHRQRPRGSPRPDPEDVPVGSEAVRKPPLFAVSGATGVGKTTSTSRLPNLVPEVIRLDGDLLWSNEYFDHPASIRRFYGIWLRLAAAIAENGRALVFCGAVSPDSWEELPERTLVGDIYYLALVCDPDVHERRLRGRGPGSQDHRFPDFLSHNRWLRDNAGSTTPPMDIIDTTRQAPWETGEAIADWIRERL